MLLFYKPWITCRGSEKLFEKHACRACIPQSYIVTHAAVHAINMALTQSFSLHTEPEPVLNDKEP